MVLIPVLQSWDDGVEDDVRLAELCRRHGARACFNLNPGLHEAVRGHGWMYQGKEVKRLARGELTDVYAGLEIANHTMTHPDLVSLDPARYEEEIGGARRLLQDWFQQPVEGFCYPFGRGDAATQRAVERAGHVMARDAAMIKEIAPGPGFMIIRPHAHFTAGDFWTRFEQAIAADGYFFFWGHSYEIMDEAGWQRMDDLYARLAADPRIAWVTLAEYRRVAVRSSSGTSPEP